MASSFSLSVDSPIYAIGSFDKHVTVLSQQTRALNLAWSLIESHFIPTRKDESPRSVAIIGAGFAGLTFAAGLLKKGVTCRIALFEQLDTLLPLQQGSDTRWLHPNVYDWPAEGSDATAAMLPVLNWTAARSSDVVVQVLGEWAQVAANTTELRLFCNTRHLQVTPQGHSEDQVRLEWVGEKRDPADGTVVEAGGAARGSCEGFDLVVLACGFGIEAGGPSYWRNEVLGQPSLDGQRSTYLVSGQGDGAMIDLQRLRVSQFRQDRILEELFLGASALVERLREIHRDYLRDRSGLFDLLNGLAADTSPHRSDLTTVLNRLAKRLRRDTDVVLRLKVRNVSDLLNPSTGRMSFQNALLTFLLYRCGAFSPSNEVGGILRSRLSIAPHRVVERHGVKPLEQLRRVLPNDFMDAFTARQSSATDGSLRQTSVRLWPGGYFGYAGREADTGKLGDDDRRTWRKEYLPGPTTLVASAICGAVKASVLQSRPDATHFRITLHRTLSIYGEELLQQACDYVGSGVEGATSTAGRTFPAGAATIGAAYRNHCIVRSRTNIQKGALVVAMGGMGLQQAARSMRPEVEFLLAMPLLQPADGHYPPSRVAAVLYLDSADPGFWLDDAEIDRLRTILEEAIRSVETPNGHPFGRVRNIPARRVTNEQDGSCKTPMHTDALEFVAGVDPPCTGREFTLNFDFTDLAPAVIGAGTGAQTARE